MSDENVVSTGLKENENIDEAHRDMDELSKDALEETVLISVDNAGIAEDAMYEDAEKEAYYLYDIDVEDFADVSVYRIPADILVDDYEGKDSSKILRGQEDMDELDEYKISSFCGYLKPKEPECDDEEGHNWTATYEEEGGAKENPGVFGHGGGVYICEHCTRCDATKTIDTWANHPATAEQGFRKVTYGKRCC